MATGQTGRRSALVIVKPEQGRFRSYELRIIRETEMPINKLWKVVALAAALTLTANAANAGKMDSQRISYKIRQVGDEIGRASCRERV